MLSFQFQPFGDFIRDNTTPQTRNKHKEVSIPKLSVTLKTINAQVDGVTNEYDVSILFDANSVISAKCSCPYNKEGYCKHIVGVLLKADDMVIHLLQRFPQKKVKEPLFTPPKKVEDGFVLENTFILDLSLLKLKPFLEILPKREYWQEPLYIDKGIMDANVFTFNLYDQYMSRRANTVVKQAEKDLHLSCDCQETSGKICVHLHYALQEIQMQELFQLPFQEEMRIERFRPKALSYGIENFANLDDIFHFIVEYRRIRIEPKVSLFALNEYNKTQWKSKLLPEFQFPKSAKNTEEIQLVVVQKDSYSKQLAFLLMCAPLAKNGGIKSPIRQVNITKQIRETKKHESLPFLTALQTLQETSGYNIRPSVYVDIFKNNLELPFYFFNYDSDKKITPKLLTPITPIIESPQATIRVDEKGDFYILSCKVLLNDRMHESKNIKLIGDYFYIQKDTLCFLNNESVQKVLSFFQENKHQIYIHKSQFKEFQESFLDELENYIRVEYSFVKIPPIKEGKSTPKVQKKASENMICLSESDDYVLITPVTSYDEVEVPILSKKNIYQENPDGTLLPIERDEKAELRFLRNIQKQHESFTEYPTTTFFYLHKQEFLEDGWFIDAFEEWRNSNYTILGFNQLKNNHYNPNKMKVSTKVSSGINWFDVSANVSFGNQTVSLKDIQKSVINKSRYVKLGDGTHGLLPQEWLDKFGHYFRTGEVKDDSIRTHKSNFHIIDELFDKEVLTDDLKIELENYREKLANFHSIRNIHVPKKLKATLRDYQKEGLNWLNFLDEFNFGGCLADDMGLGKTIQIIAYFLAQHEKGNNGVNLVVVPTSLLFNWQKEIEKFAPHLKFHVLYGANRNMDKKHLEKQHLVITTYGTLLSDIEQLKEIAFNIIVLDESQAIKNVESKRYKAVRLLQGRQRLVVTGTPVENNTFDLYAQLSFATPGLLGNAKRFAADYSTPIDKFQDAERAKELQQKVHPFILRRTKKQVAKELPEKTEMVVYCEMETEQRRVYDTYKEEFRNYLSGLTDDELHSSSLHVLQGLTKLRQICNSPALLSDEEFYGNQSAKLNTLMEYVEDLKGEHKMIIFSQFVGMLELIKTELEKNNIPFAYLTGKTKNREAQVDLFQNEEEIRVFLISLKAGGTGLNLTKAEYVFLVDPWWNPAVENQAIDRAYRIGQKNKVVAIRLITPDTIEEKIIELQQRKKQLVEDLIHTDNNVLKQLNREDLMRMI